MSNYKQLDNLVNTIGNYIQDNSERIWKGTKYLVIFPTLLALGLNVLPNFQKYINKIIPTANTNISEADAAETKPNVLEYFHNTLELRKEKIAENKILREEKTLEDYLLKNLKKSSRIVDLEGYKQIPRDYNFSNVQKKNLDDKLLEWLNLDPDMKLSYEVLNVQNQEVRVFNIIDSDSICDGQIYASTMGDGRVRVFLDWIESSDINLASSGLKTYDIEAVMCDVIKSKAKGYNLYRISDGETTFGFVIAPEKLAIKEILKGYKKNDAYNLFNGAILGSPFVKSKITKPTSDNGDNGDGGDQEQIPEPSLEQELNDNNDPQDPANTGSDPNTDEGSTPENPVVNPDPPPHEF